MPSTITHAFMAKDIYNKLDNNLKKIFKDRIDEYITYSQGPDVLFFYPFIPLFKKSISIRKLGSIVHRNKVNKLFISLINDIKYDKDIDKFIFLSGLVTHYVGDTICHPFINYKAWILEKEFGHKKDYHFLVESYIDNYILKLKGKNYKKYKCYKLIKNSKNKKIKEMIDNCFKEVFYKKDMGSSYFKSLNNMKLSFLIVRYDPYKIKRIGYSLVYYLLPFLNRDIRYLSYNYNLTDKENIFYLNLYNGKWFNIKNKEIIYNKSFLDLYNEVIEKSVYMIEKLYDYIYEDKEFELESFFGNLSYANGLPIKK